MYDDAEEVVGMLAWFSLSCKAVNDVASDKFQAEPRHPQSDRFFSCRVSRFFHFLGSDPGVPARPCLPARDTAVSGPTFGPLRVCSVGMQVFRGLLGRLRGAGRSLPAERSRPGTSRTKPALSTGG